MGSTADRLASRIEELPEGSMRRRVLEGARRFKASWVEFARLLSQVRSDELWRGWGHKSFESYCSRELFIRRQTADKLTLSYGFLERHEPQLARAREAPPFEIIEVLSRAEAAGRLTPSGYAEMRDEILERSPTPAAVSRRIAERFGPAPRPPRPDEPERLGRLAEAARHLAQACRAEEAVPRALADRAQALARDLAVLVTR
jgi:hypothetical protein